MPSHDRAGPMPPLHIPSRRPSISSQHSHRRTSSSSTAASSPSMGTAIDLMAVLSSSPRGSKMAEDARRARGLAERAAAAAMAPSSRRPGWQHIGSRPGSPASPPRERAIPPPRSPPSVPLPQTPTEDPFEYDGVLSELSFDRMYAEQLALPRTPTDWPDAPAYPPEASVASELPYRSPERRSGSEVPASSPGRERAGMVRPRPQHFAGVPMAQNALAIFWRGPQPQTFAVITEPVGHAGADETYPIEVHAQHTQVLEMPPVWSGRVQRVNDGQMELATRCEIQFGGYKGLTYFGVSYAEGNNGPVVIRGQQSGRQAGCHLQAARIAPEGIVQRLPNGEAAVYGTTHGPRQRRLAVRQFYRNFLESPEMGAITSEDVEATLATRDHHLLLDFS